MVYIFTFADQQLTYTETNIYITENYRCSHNVRSQYGTAEQRSIMAFKNFIPIAVFLVLIQSNAMAIEEPSYEVIETYEEFEVRRYQPYLLAEVDVSGGINSAGNKAFRILAGYIFGDNAAATKMAMTAPVESRPTGQGEKMAMTAPVTATATATATATNKDGDEMTTVAFVMEQKYSIDTLPIPNDERIRIREVAERIVAVRRYSGRWTDTNYQRNLQLLIEALSNVSLEVVGEPILARYNSPFSLPMLRRNEVMVEIEATEPNVDAISSTTGLDQPPHGFQIAGRN
jgi:hypothetical protein